MGAGIPQLTIWPLPRPPAAAVRTKASKSILSSTAEMQAWSMDSPRSAPRRTRSGSRCVRPIIHAAAHSGERRRQQAQIARGVSGDTEDQDPARGHRAVPSPQDDQGWVRCRSRTAGSLLPLRSLRGQPSADLGLRDLGVAKAGLCPLEPSSRHLYMGVDEVVERTGGVAFAQLKVAPNGELDPIRRIGAEIEIPPLRVFIRFGGIDREPADSGQVELRPAVVALDPTRWLVFGDGEADLESGRNTLCPGEGDEQGMIVGTVAVPRGAGPEGIAVPPARADLLVLHRVDHIIVDGARPPEGRGIALGNVGPYLVDEGTGDRHSPVWPEKERQFFSLLRGVFIHG